MAYDEEMPIEIQGMDEALSKLGALESLRFNEYFKPFLQKAATLVSSEYLKQIPSYLEVTRRNGMFKKIYDNGPMNLSAVIGPKYRGYFLYGTRWGWTDKRSGRQRKDMPSTDQLEAWVREKINPPESQVESITFAIARALAIKGIPPRDVQQDVTNETKDLVSDLLSAGVEFALEEIYGNN